MTLQSITGYAATAVLSCGAGWLMTAPDRTPDPPLAAARVAPASAVAPRVDNGPLIAVSSDGNVTLRVEQQPLEWVLEQIAQQSGWADLQQRAGANGAPVAATAAAAASAPAVCAEASILTPAQAAQLLQVIERGGETDRYDGLLQARSEGVSVPDSMLKWMFETDTSERVRLLAFENYLEPRTGSADATRSALQAALYVPNAAIQSEAKRRLEELLESERIDAVSVQRADP